MIVGLDIDSVLADFQTKLRQSVKNVFNVDFAGSFYTDVRNQFCITKEEEYKKFEDIFKNTADFPPVSGAAEGCKQLKKDGHSLIAITARKYREVTRQWMNENGFPDIPICFMDLGDYIPEVDCLLDDYPKKIATLHDSTRLQAFLLDCPWNQHSYDIFNRYKRVRNWPHFIKEIRLLNR